MRDDAVGVDLNSLSLDDLLRSLPALAADVELANARLRERVLITHARRATWTEIGNALKVSRQAAWERYGRTR